MACSWAWVLKAPLPASIAPLYSAVRGGVKRAGQRFAVPTTEKGLSGTGRSVEAAGAAAKMASAWPNGAHARCPPVDLGPACPALSIQGVHGEGGA